MALLTLRDAELAFGLHPLLDRAALSIEAGERIGLIGRNGTGKSSLLQVLAGRAQLDDGELVRTDGLRIAMVEQEPALPSADTVLASLQQRGAFEAINDERERWRLEARLVEFLQRFELDAHRAPTTTSGGERNRLLLARLFARPANVLVMDEPTNDLDIESLELLEDTLQAYAGTLLLVSHDRTFLDNVVTQTLVAEGEGKWREYVGGYTDWLAQRPEPVSSAPEKEAKPAQKIVAPAARTKLSYKEARELELLPKEIDALEQEQQALHAKMSTPDYHKTSASDMGADGARIAEIETLLMEKLERWTELEGKNAKG